MTNVEPKVESIEELDFDVMCQRKTRIYETGEIISTCTNTAKYWAKGS